MCIALLHSLTIYGARAVNFYITSAMKNYGAST